MKKRGGDAIYADGVQRHFLAQYPKDFLRDALSMLLHTYPSSHDDCGSGRAEPEVRDLYPHMRRAAVEGQLRQIAKEHGITATVETNCKKSQNYTLLSSGNVLLTASAVENPNKIARPAVYRETYARTGELKLFGEEPPTTDTLYAILQHGPDPVNRAQLDFAYVVFPDESYSQQVTRINLLEMFRDVVDRHRANVRNDAVSEPDIRLRPNVKKGAED
jgi:hypothetical protein